MIEDHEKLKWFVKEGSNIIGPLTWQDLEFMINSGDISRRGHLKSEEEETWIPIKDYFPKRNVRSSLKNDLNDLKNSDNKELRGLIPKRSDLIFLIGVVAFFIGSGLFFFVKFLGIFILVVSLVLEFYAIYFSYHKEERSTVKEIGNNYATMWTFIQAAITILFLFIGLS